MNAKDILKQIEEGYRKLCEQQDLSLDKLYEMQALPCSLFVSTIERTPPSEENQFNAEKYIGMLTAFDDKFLRIGGALSLYRHGANADGIVLALQCVEVADILMKAVKN